MTTKVTVDAHAGWPVLVEAIDQHEDEQKTSVLATVQAGSEQVFHVHSTRQLLITELPNS